MLEQDRLYNSNFHYYFDRNNNFHSYVFFNFVEFYKDYFPNAYFYTQYDDFVEFIKNNIIFNFYLQDDSNTKILNFENAVILPYYSQNFLFFKITKNAIQYSEKFKIVCRISFEDQFYNYISSDKNNPILIQNPYEYEIYKNYTKNILDKKYVNDYKPINLKQTYEFESENINFSENVYKVSNLYEIFSENISLTNYTNFIDKYENIKKISYSGRVPLTSYIKQKNVYNLNFDIENKKGDSSNHLELILATINHNKTIDYKETSFLKNTFIDEERKAPTKTIKMFDHITSIESNSCEIELFKEQKLKELLGTNILYVSTFFDSFDIKDYSYWIEDYNLLPVYILELMTDYNIYYLSNIDENSLFEEWTPLLKTSLSDLKNTYCLCKIVSNNNILQDYLIENYFMLIT